MNPRIFRKAMFRGTAPAQDNTFGWRTRDEWFAVQAKWAQRQLERASRRCAFPHPIPQQESCR